MCFLFKLQTDINRGFRFSSRISVPEGASEISWQSCYIPGPLPEAPIQPIGGTAQDCISNTPALDADAVVSGPRFENPGHQSSRWPLGCILSWPLIHVTPMQVKSEPSRSDAPALLWFTAPVHALSLHPPTPCLPLAGPHGRSRKGRRTGKGRHVLPEDEADSRHPVNARPRHVSPGWINGLAFPFPLHKARQICPLFGQDFVASTLRGQPETGRCLRLIVLSGIPGRGIVPRVGKC